MRIHRTLSFYLSASDHKHEKSVRQSGIVNDELPKFASAAVNGADVIKDRKDLFPGMIELRCRMVPNFIDGVTAAFDAQMTYAGKTLIPTPLFSKERLPISSVSLVYCGDGFFQKAGKRQFFKGYRFQGDSLDECRLSYKDVLYKHPFLVPKSNLKLSTNIVKQQTIVDPPGIPDVQALFPYGGGFYEGIKIEDIQQYFCMVSSNSTHTLVSPHGARSLASQGLSCNQKGIQKLQRMGNVMLLDVLQKPIAFSIVEEIAVGSVQCVVSSKDNQIMNYTSIKSGDTYLKVDYMVRFF